MKNARPFTLLLGDDEWDRIRLIKAIHPVSTADVMRMGLSATCKALGFESEPDLDLVRKSNMPYK